MQWLLFSYSALEGAPLFSTDLLKQWQRWLFFKSRRGASCTRWNLYFAYDLITTNMPTLTAPVRRDRKKWQRCHLLGKMSSMPASFTSQRLKKKIPVLCCPGKKVWRRNIRGSITSTKFNKCDVRYKEEPELKQIEMSSLRIAAVGRSTEAIALLISSSCVSCSIFSLRCW